MNTTARWTKQIEKIKEDLIYGVSKPIYWYDSISVLHELGVSEFYEISQATVLTEIGNSCYENLKWRGLE